jgi:Zn-dependent membrane protease YugP
MPVVSLLLVALVPALLTACGLALLALESRRPALPLPEPAGPWIERVVARTGLPLQVEVVPAETPDAYWPNAATLGLSEATYGGRRPKDWAVAAHELGHALNVAWHPAMAALLPGARLGSVLGWRLCVAGLIAAALFGEPIALTVAALALVASVACTAVVCADEVAASLHAARLIRADPVGKAGLGRASAAMGAAASAYLLGAVGQVLVLLAFPWLAQAILAEPMAVKVPSDLGFTLVMAVTPIVCVRTALAMWQAVRPEPVPSELDLWDLLGREARWESVCAIGIVGAVASMYPAVGGPAAAVATALAVSVAIGPVQGLGAALIALPVVVLRRFTVRPTAPARYLKRARDDVPAAMVAMWSDPPWYLRATWLMPLAYLPLVAILAVRVFSVE